MKALRLLTLLVIGWYLFLIACHYFNPRPLWLDEYWVFVNIKDAALGNLFFQSLSHAQEFPRVYLYLVGLLAKAFHNHLFALRFLPFLSMLAAFLIWIHLAQKQIKSSVGLLTFVLCWAASIPLIYYASELKQYSMDVLIGAIFASFLFYQEQMKKECSTKQYCLILMLLTFTSFFSYIAFLFMLLPLYNLWKSSKKSLLDQKIFWFYSLFCGLCFLGVYWIDFKGSRTDLLMVYWKDYFISFDSLESFFRSFQEVLNNLISRWFAENPKWIRAASRFLMGIGLIYLMVEGIRNLRGKGFRFKSIQDIAFFVLCTGLILSALKKLPLGVPRLSLFFAPILFISTVKALEWLKDKNQIIYRCIQYPFIVFLICVSLGIAGVIFTRDLGAQSVIWH